MKINRLQEHVKLFCETYGGTSPQEQQLVYDFADHMLSAFVEKLQEDMDLHDKLQKESTGEKQVHAVICYMASKRLYNYIESVWKGNDITPKAFFKEGGE